MYKYGNVYTILLLKHSPYHLRLHRNCFLKIIIVLEHFLCGLLLFNSFNDYMKYLLKFHVRGEKTAA